MKAKVLISFYSGESGRKAHRVYLEPAFEQAQKDLDLILETNPDRSFEIQECEVFDYRPNLGTPLFFQIDAKPKRLNPTLLEVNDACETIMCGLTGGITPILNAEDTLKLIDLAVKWNRAFEVHREKVISGMTDELIDKEARAANSKGRS